MRKLSIVSCPFVLAGLSGITALGADIFWLIFDTVIKTDEFSKHPVEYSIVLGGLSLAMLLIILAVIQYKRRGLLKHELKIMGRN
jgi:hypothetical protein